MNRDGIENYKILNIDYFHQFTKGENVKIAVLDSEIDLSHPEFDGRKIKYREFIPSEGINSHGTAVSSLIIGNNIGVSPESSLYHLKMLSDIYGSGVSWDKAMSFVLREKVDLVCMSIGTKDRLSASMKQTIQTAKDRRIMIFAPSGNEGKTVLRNPADNDNVIAVGGITSKGEISKKSNRSVRIEGYAPSEDVLVALSGGSQLYTKKDGTSFANAIFVGQMSLIISYARSKGKEIRIRDFLEFYGKRNREKRKVFDMKVVKEELDLYLNV